MVVALAGAGVVFYSHYMIKPEPTNHAIETSRIRESVSEHANIKPIPIKKMVVNLKSDPHRLRFVEIEMSVLPFFEDQKQIISKNEHLLKNVVIELALVLTPEEIETVSGKMLFESRIKKQVNAKLGQPVIKQIFFSKFIIQ